MYICSSQYKAINILLERERECSGVVTYHQNVNQENLLIALVLTKFLIQSSAALLTMVYGFLTVRDSWAENQKGVKASQVEHT